MLDRLFSVRGIESGPASVGTIRIELRQQSGKTLAYPICENAIGFAQVARRKTLSAAVISTAQAMGYQVIASQKTLKMEEVA